MPTLTRTKKPIVLLQPPTHTDDQIEVLQIRFTGEIFTDYDQYWERLRLYNQRIWECAETGKSKLTYEQALNSELEARKILEDRLPDVWRKPCLELIQFNTRRLNQLVDEIHEWFKENAIVGEQVTIEIESTQHDAKITEVIQAHSRPGPNPYAAPPVNPDATWPDVTLYRVHQCALDGTLLPPHTNPNQPTEYWVSLNAMKRNRVALSKNNLREFVRENASKDPWQGAPWLIRADLAGRYGISTTPPVNVQANFEVREEKELKIDDRKRKKTEDGAPTQKRAANHLMSTLNLPVEDLELLSVPPRANQPPIPRPIPTSDFGAVPQELVPDVLVIWTFLGVFGKSLHLSPFTLDDFISSLSYQGLPASTLLVEVFGSLLHLACLEWSLKVDAAIRAAANQPATFIDHQTIPIPPEQRVALHVDDIDKPMHETANTLYAKLIADERASLDQWWKWYPGRWHSGMDGHRPSVAALLANTRAERSIPNTKRLRAWEVVLAGLVRDWIPADCLANKWTVLSLLLGGELDGRGGEPPSVHSAASSEMGDERTASPSVNGTNNIDDNDDSLAGGSGHLDVVNGGGSVSNNGNSTSTNNRKRAADTPDTASYHEDMANYENGNGSEDDSRPIQRKSSRTKKPKIVKDESPDPDSPIVSALPHPITSLRERPIRATRTATPDMLSATTPTNNTSQTPTPPIKKKAPPPSRRSAAAAAQQSQTLDIDRLLQVTEYGFVALTVAEKVKILKFLADECCMTSNVIRDAFEASLVRISELKTEKRDVNNLIKALAQSKRDLKKQRSGAVAAAKAAKQTTRKGGAAAATPSALAPATPASAIAAIKMEDDPPLSDRMTDNSSDLSDHAATSSGEDNGDSDGGTSNATGSDDRPSSRKRSKKTKTRVTKKGKTGKQPSSSTLTSATTRNSSSTPQPTAPPGPLSSGDVIQNIAQERLRIEEEELKLAKRQLFLDQEIRRLEGVSRIRPLGRDRHYNRYWWYDEYVGAYPPGSELPDAPPVPKGHKARPAVPIVLEWAAGRVFVEEFGVGVGAHSVNSVTDVERDAAGVGIAYGRGKAVRWGCYQTVEEVDLLMKWLNARGVRESALLNGIARVQPLILGSVGKRVEDLTATNEDIEEEGKTDVDEEMGQESNTAASPAAPKRQKQMNPSSSTTIPSQSSRFMAPFTSDDHLEYLNKEARLVG
ncbi:hypothetical protein SmJEL517_g00043 [Synchytrium microbalum]|uniref:WAC domain-containing protein n=1 Tax=Synchytrium microbalum TaxID=1806994 RepID=A0A507CIQ4_9FUNG|nr:uncharacterized protein SmJEL517_g00043 [Synchytrium microbalum]TPX38034.1 hypothetical protein SmJEL517_g00043 [Synchytrium microbalum]